MGSLAGMGRDDIKSLFGWSLENAPLSAMVRSISSVVKSDQATEHHKWPGVTPAARLWADGRHVHSLPVKGFDLSNEKYELSIEIPNDDRERAKNLPLIMDQIYGMGQRIGGQLEWDLLVALIIKAVAAATDDVKSYDGQYFFSTTHSEEDSGTQLNVLAATQVPALDVSSTSAVTVAEAAKILLQTSAYMKGYKDNRGKIMDREAMGFQVWCPTLDLYAAFQSAVRADYVTSGEPTVVQKLIAAGQEKFEIVYVPELSGYTTNIWFFRIGSEIPGRRPRAFILQEEGSIEDEFLGSGSDEAFFHDRWVYGTKRKLAVGLWDWRHAAKLTIS